MVILMEMNLVLAIGIIIVIGFLGGLAAERLKLPRITGYIIRVYFLKTGS